MPMRIDTTADQPVLILEGIISIEETDQLIEVLKEYPGIRVDLSGCEHLHTAPLQTLKILKTSIISMPADPFWEMCLAHESTKETDIP